MAFAFLLSWLSRSTSGRPKLHLIVYSRRACPLCDDAINTLSRVQGAYGFTIEVIDVDDSEELQREYGNCVPVVAIDGKVRFRGHVNEVLLRRILQRSE